MKYYASFFNETKRYDVLPEVKMNKILSEELDAFEFTLSTLEVKINFDFKKHNGLIPVSLFIIDEDNEEIEHKTYLSSYNYIRVEYNPDRWQCVIQAVSPAFYLQRITLPNKMITQPITNEKRSVFVELKKIMDVYAPNILIDERLQTLLNVPCPEFQFVKATLHEVLITLFAVCKLVPTMPDYNVLSYLELKETNVNHKLSDFNRFQISNNVSEYADMIDYDLENAISNEQDIETNWLLPTSDEPTITTENYYWKLPSNIYEIKRVEILGNNFEIYAYDSWVNLENENINITDYVVSKDVYDTLKTSTSVNAVEGKDYKRNNIYYENNGIYGASYRDDKYLDWLSNPQAIVNAVYWSLKDTGLNFSAIRVDNYRKILIKVKYQTEADNSRVKIVKAGVEKPINNLISNQEESYIDLINFGNQKKETINRMGNEKYLLSQNYNFIDYKLNEIPEIGDTVEKDYIIYEKQMQFYENNVIVNFILAKNFVFQTGYSGLKQVKRFTSIDKENTVVRNDLFMFNFKLEQQKENDDYYAEKILNGYGIGKEYGINLHGIRTRRNDLPVNDYAILLAVSENKTVADSVICHFQFETNYKAGDKTDLISGKDTYLKVPVSYTDLNGEFETISIFFGGHESLRNETDYFKLSQLPEIVSEYGSTHYDDFLINKDNREITSITLQFRVFGDNEKVIVYDDFMKHTGLTSHNSPFYKIYVKDFSTKTEMEKDGYKINTTTPIGELNENLTLVVNKEDLSISINNVAYVEDVGFISVGVCDQYNNLILGLNYDKRELSNQTNIKLFLNRKY